MNSSTSGSGKFFWKSLDRPTRSIRLLHMQWTKLMNLYDNVYLDSFGRKFIKIGFWSDSVNWFDKSYTVPG